jgi:hypothetical protein
MKNLKQIQASADQARAALPSDNNKKCAFTATMTWVGARLSVPF